MRISILLNFLWLFCPTINLVAGDGSVLEEHDDSDNDPDDSITMFTVANTDTGSTWKSLPYREKFQWQSLHAPCRSFKLKVPDERKDHDEIEICIFRPQLDYSDDLDTLVHSVDNHDEVYEQREMQVQGFVKGKEKSVVSGRMVDKLFYGEVSFYDSDSDDLIVYEVEEISLLTKLLRHDKKVLRSLLYVMNKGDKANVALNAVVTKDLSLLTFITNDKSDDASSRSFLIFSTSHISYISSGETNVRVDELGRLKIGPPSDARTVTETEGLDSSKYEITVDMDGSVILSTKHKKYKFRPNGQTIVTRGDKDVEILHEHEGAVALMAFTNSLTYDCVLPSPSFRKNRKGGFLCRICLIIDNSFQKYYKSPSNQSAVSSLNHVIDRVSWIFRAVDWNKDSVSDNIGLEYDSRIRQWNPQMGDQEFLTKDDVDVVFTDLSQIDFSECCLAVAYTMKAFPDSLYAKSSLMSQPMMPSGICAIRNQGLSLNVILISANNKKGNYVALSEEQLIYLTAHEIAKSFGAPLDPTGKESCDRFHDDTKAIRHYIMWPVVLRNLTEEEKQFSSCTIEFVHNSLMGCKTACFEVNHYPFCGNGIVEEGEACDCGSSHSCSKQLCCYARSGKYPCRKTGVPCSASSDLKMLTKTNCPLALLLYTLSFLSFQFACNYIISI